MWTPSTGVTGNHLPIRRVILLYITVFIMLKDMA